MITDKTIQILLNVIRKKYPFITDVEYFIDHHVKPFGYFNHLLIFYVNVRELSLMFPNELLDKDYIKESKVWGSPTEIFVNWEDDNTIKDYGWEVDRLINTLVKSALGSGIEYMVGYNTKDKKYK